MLAKHAVLSIGRQGVGVLGVGAECLHFRDEVLVPEELADVADRTAGEGAVGELGGILVNNDVDVDRTAGVLAWRVSNGSLWFEVCVEGLGRDGMLPRPDSYRGLVHLHVLGTVC